jgi:Gentisate 1,2-dioxygenase
MYKSDMVKDFTVTGGKSLARYHYAEKGAKTYVVLKGSVGAVLNGRKTVLTEGDIFNAEAWYPYSLELLGDDTVVREVSACKSKHVCFLPDPADPVDTDKAEIGEVSCKGKCIYEFSAEGINLQLKVGRWQLDGVKEIWECNVEKGYRIAFNNRLDCEGLYMIKSGEFLVQVDDREFILDESTGEIVSIPAETAFAFTALTENCVIQDFSVDCHLFRLLEMVEAAQDYFPEKLEDQSYKDYLFEANKVIAFESIKKEQDE